MYQPFYPEEIWIEERVASLPTTNEILGKLSSVPTKWIKDIGEILIQKQLRVENKILVLAKQSGKFLKPCPGTQNYVCCNYYFLNLSTNCDINCSYCILQGYLNNPYMTVYTNLEDMFNEVDKILRRNPNQFFRIGTGELTDSLTLDYITNYSKKLIPFFLNYSNAILELKTKTTQINNLLELSPEKRVIVSWSLNPDEIIKLEEKNAPTLEQRLNAAQICAESGYLVGFHFDPLIYYPDWEHGYQAVVKELFKMVPTKQIVWISLGALRYPAEMDKIVREKHPDSQIVLGEMYPGKDGKLRYFRPFREKMFKKIVNWIQEESDQVQIYLCMESPEVWRKINGLQNLSQCGLPKQLDQAITCFKNEFTG